jgi:hypothetical protein
MAMMATDITAATYCAGGKSISVDAPALASATLHIQRVSAATKVRTLTQCLEPTRREESVQYLLTYIEGWGGPALERQKLCFRTV